MIGPGRPLSRVIALGFISLLGSHDHRESGFSPSKFEESVRRVAHPGQGAEAYFSPDGRRLIYQGKFSEASPWHTLTAPLLPNGLQYCRDCQELLGQIYFTALHPLQDAQNRSVSPYRLFPAERSSAAMRDSSLK